MSSAEQNSPKEKLSQAKPTPDQGSLHSPPQRPTLVSPPKRPASPKPSPAAEQPPKEKLSQAAVAKEGGPEPSASAEAAVSAAEPSVETFPLPANCPSQ